MLSTTLVKCLSTIEKVARLADSPLARIQRLLTGLQRIVQGLAILVAALAACSVITVSILSAQLPATVNASRAAVEPNPVRATDSVTPSAVNAEPASMADAGPPDVGDAAEGTGLSVGQREKAASIIAVGEQMGIPRRGWVIAVATAMQESKLLMYANSDVPASLQLPHEAVGSDHDSVGLFQQRPNWGTMGQRMDVTTSARLFYEALAEVPGWRHMPLTVAAQDVQVSAFPDAYAKWESLATDLVGALAPVVGATGGGPTGALPAPEPDVQASPEEPEQQPAPPQEQAEEAAETVADPPQRPDPLDRILVLRDKAERAAEKAADDLF